MKNIFILVVEDGQSSVHPISKNSREEILAEMLLKPNIDKQPMPIAVSGEAIKAKRTYTKRRRVNITPVNKAKSIFKGAGGGKFKIAISKSGKTYKRYFKKIV